MATTTDTTKSTQPERPGLHDGVAGEFLVMTKIKPGQADALRQTLGRSERLPSGTGAPRGAAGHRHLPRRAARDLRQRHAVPVRQRLRRLLGHLHRRLRHHDIADVFSEVFAFSEGFPGISDPNVKDWFVAHQVPAMSFISSYPELTTKQILKDQRVNEAFQAVLDSPEFRAA